MPDIPRQKLIEIVARFGPQVSEDAKRCEGLLRDYCNDHKREIVVLVAAISDGVTTELRGSKGNLPKDVLVERLALRLHDNVGFVMELCKWGVETWALALGICQLSDLVSKPLNSSTDERKAKLPPTNAASAACFTNSIGVKLVQLPAGTFMMGDGDEAHQVTLTKPFYLGVYEVTQEQYQQVMGNNLSKFKGAQNPVETVSWEDAVEFCKRLSELPEEKNVGRVYRLPTEAEWEYACRAGSITKFSFGDDEGQLGDYAWFSGNSNRKTHPVGQKQPNAWGLYDMHGNVWEWCNDWYGEYPKGTVSDPLGPTEGGFRVIRGGCWDSGAASCRSAYRNGTRPSDRFPFRFPFRFRRQPINTSGDYYFGFRVALSSR